MAGHVHKVGEYAPESTELLVSHYANGGVEHVFGINGSERTVSCKVSAHEDEEAALKAFQARYAPTIPAPAADRLSALAEATEEKHAKGGKLAHQLGKAKRGGK
jgi:hypothetical protein